MKREKGSIAIFVLVALLFMSAFLIISFASNVNKSKTVKEQFNIISGIYAYAKGEEGAYDKAYSDLRNKNKQTMTASSENSSTLELTKTFNENLINYRIYGNSVQNGTPTPDNPVAVQSVGDLVTDTTDVNYGKYKITVKANGKNLLSSIKNYNKSDDTTESDFILFEAGKYYTFSFDNITSTTWRIMLDVYDTDKNPISFTSQISNEYLTGFYCVSDTNRIQRADNNSGKYYTFMCKKTFYGKNVRFFSGDTDANTVMINPQIEEGQENTEFEPYYNPIIKNIYLDEPLRKIGDYADYIDFKTGKVVRNVGEYKITGDETWNKFPDTNCYYITEVIPTKYEENINCLSNKYQGQVSGSGSSYSSGNAWIQSTDAYKRFYLADNNYSTADEFKNNLQEQYASGNPVIVNFPLATEDNSETLNLPQLKSFEDYTKIEVLTSVAPSKIEAEYQGYTLE